VFPFYIHVFALWLIMVDPSFITSDSTVQKGVTLLMILAQKVVTGIQMVMCVLFHECIFYSVM
jgi:hypothetical protein